MERSITMFHVVRIANNNDGRNRNIHQVDIKKRNVQRTELCQQANLTKGILRFCVIREIKMGLDINHLQLTLTENNKGDYFYIEDWDSTCNVPLENYSKYITTVEEFDFNKTLAIIKNEELFEKLKKAQWFDASGYLKIFIGDMNATMKEQLNKFIVSQNLDKLEKIELGCEHDGLAFYTMSFGEPIQVKAVKYIDSIGYQRRGMNNLFYDAFNKYLLWGKKEDFEFAYTFIGNEWYLEYFGEESVNRMKRNFKENFLDKYEFGKSLLCVSF